MTTEQKQARKIRQLERDIKWCREEIARRDENERLMQCSLESERSWRRTFQKLVKDAAFSDTLGSYDDD